MLALPTSKLPKTFGLNLINKAESGHVCLHTTVREWGEGSY